MKSGKAISDIIDVAQEFLYSIDDLKDAVYCERQDEDVLGVFKDLRLGSRCLLKNIKKLRLEDFFSHNPGFLFSLGFIGCSRRAFKCFRSFKRSLHNSLKFYSRSKFDKANKWLGRSADYLNDSLKFLKKLDDRINTELGTAKSVQIQIQKGRKNM